jgi:hypothetical protein
MGESPNPLSSKELRIATPPVGHLMATDACQTDADLAAVVGAWDRLTEAVRASIMMLVKASGGGR